MNISRLSELSYLFAVDSGENISGAYTKVSHSMKFTGYGPLLNQLFISMSVAISIGEIYGDGFEFIPGFIIQFNFMKNLAVFGSYENRILNESLSPTFYGIGLEYHYWESAMVIN